MGLLPLSTFILALQIDGFFNVLAERMGFEPMRDLHLLAVFETAPFNRLGTSPKRCHYITNSKIVINKIDQI